jgi:membrane dipeptidase
LRVASTTGRGRAEELLARVPLVDGHNDLPWALRDLAGWGEFGEKSTAGDRVPSLLSSVSTVDLTVRQPALQTDLVRARDGRLGMQFWSVWVPCRLAGDAAVTAVLEQVEPRATPVTCASRPPPTRPNGPSGTGG